jgi:hypothetical protein
VRWSYRRRKHRRSIAMARTVRGKKYKNDLRCAMSPRRHASRSIASR